MATFMPQPLFDGCAYRLGFYWCVAQLPGKEGDFDWAHEGLISSYSPLYPDDYMLATELKLVPKMLDDIVSNVETSLLVRAEIFYRCSSLAEKYLPDGSPKKKFLGFFGGTHFSGSHPTIERRSPECLENFSRYSSFPSSIRTDPSPLQKLIRR